MQKKIRGIMKNFGWLLALAAIPFLASGVGSAQQQASKAPEPAWAFPVPSEQQPTAQDNGEPKHLPGSTMAYTMAQIEDLANPPDWFPNEHPPAPSVVTHAVGKGALACGSCHLMSGLGHPESANLAGLPAAYIDAQMEDFRSGARIDPARMNVIARAISVEDARAASEYFASLKPRFWEEVSEMATVPQTYVGKTRMRFVLPGGGTEPIGNRIIEVPKSTELAEDRDANSGFLVYVPIGSIKKGELLATTGGSGSTVGCDNCHGEGLKGGRFGEPGIAGRSPLYVARQLYGFKRFSRNGPGAQLMQPVVENLSDEDILDLAAYLASLAP
jgi:cytochrome c553